MTYVYIIGENFLMETMGKRLSWARERAGFSSARQAALRHHWGYSTYAAHENGQNDYDDKAAARYAKAFKVSAGWLLTGEGSPSPKSMKHPVVNYVAGGSELVPIDDYPQGEGIEEVELPAEQGYVTAEMLARRVPDYLERIWYISGPPPMVNVYTKLLRQAGLPKTHIVRDFFPGLA